MPLPPRRSSTCFAASLLAAALLCTAGGCVVTRAAVTPLEVEHLQGRKPPKRTPPAKVHLRDGSVVLFARGFTVDGDVLRGVGEQYDLARTHRATVETVPVGQVVSIVGYGRKIDAGGSAVGALAVAAYGMIYGPVILAMFILLSL